MYTQSLYLVETCCEWDEIYILDLESGASIDLEETRSVLRDDPVESEISELGICLYLCRIEEDIIPIWERFSLEFTIFWWKYSCITHLIL